jgi:adenylate cyclase
MARQQWVGGAQGKPAREEAIVRLCKQATQLDGEYAQAWALMALAQLELRFWHGRDEDAVPAAARALEIDPGLAEAHCVKARYLEDEGRADEAEQQIRTALKLDPESWEVNREAARMLFRHGRIPEAIPYFAKTSSLMTTDWNSPMMLVCCYSAKGDATKIRESARHAVERAERAVAQDPTNGTALGGGAYCLAASGDEDRARDWIRRSLLLDPDNLSMRYNVACTLALKLGDVDPALEALAPYLAKVTSATRIRHAEADPDLDPIRDDPRFKTMVSAAKQRLGMAEAAADA